MVWGCFSRDGTGPLVQVEGIMRKEDYMGILTDHMHPYMKRHRGKISIFQQDRDPKHTANVVQYWFKKKKVNVLEWPPQSPDLNPIENLWELLNRKKNERKPSKKDLFKVPKEEWEKIGKETLVKYVDSMPNRCKPVLKAKGLATKY